MEKRSRAISPQATARLAEIRAKYPNPKSAIMPALYLAQEELGYINDQAIAWVAKELDIPPAHVVEVATFYTMYYKKPVGKYHLQICRTLSCALAGAGTLKQYLHERLEIGAGQVSADGMWSWEEVECLGSCGTGPVVQINDVYFERMTVEKLGALLERIRREKPDLRFSTKRDELGGGLPKEPRSQVL